MLGLIHTANYQRSELNSNLIRCWSELNQHWIHTENLIFSELNRLTGKEKNTNKTKMAGKKLTLLEL